VYSVGRYIGHGTEIVAFVPMILTAVEEPLTSVGEERLDVAIPVTVVSLRRGMYTILPGQNHGCGVVYAGIFVQHKTTCDLRRFGPRFLRVVDRLHYPGETVHSHVEKTSACQVRVV
jgi:hypothetical protein